MSYTTEAAVLTQLQAPLHLKELRIPQLQPGQVLVDVHYSGVCHTQMLEVQGKRGEDGNLPHVLGHEGAGVVREVGVGVGKVAPGDRVVLSWIKGTGSEVPTTVYDSGCGPVNSGAIATFMRQTVTCENRLALLPDAVPLREAALLGCAIPTGAGVIFNSAQVSPGRSVAVFGVGGIGLSSVMAASLANAHPVIAVDIVAHKLEQAGRLGATHLVNALEQDALARVRELTGGRGADFAVEAAGKTAVAEIALQSVRDNGGLCVLAGNPPFGERIAVDPFDLIRGKRLVGTWGGESELDGDVALYAKLYQTGKLKLAELITDTYRLGDINRALEDLERGKVGRALVDMEAD